MSSAPPRRFMAEPIETIKSSKAQSNEQSKTTTTGPLKFNPEPIETAQKTNRRFVPEAVETTVRSSHGKGAQEQANTAARRFKPEPIETIESSTRRDVRDKPRIVEPVPAPGTQEKKAPRRFAPQLIGTAKRSRKAGDTGPAVLPSDKTEATPGDRSGSAKKLQMKTSPPPEASQNPLFLEIKGKTSPLSIGRRGSRGSTRSHHSFRVPELDPIESSGSEGSCPGSPSTSPSPVSDVSYKYKEATRMRESVDDKCSGYLLDLAAGAAEKHLQEQAMAAFPNSDYHEPVDHFIDRDSEESEIQPEDARRRRESSFTKVNWEQIAMQQHREESEKQQRKEDEKKKRREAEMNMPTYTPWGNPAALVDSSVSKNIIGGWQKDKELDRMRKGARPPMLGSDIKFPRCPSPEPARFDPTQGSHSIKSAMCYLTEQNQASEKGESLWCGKNTPSNQPSSLWSNPSSRQPSHGGLWGGCCVNSGLTPPRRPSGIITPKIELGNPLETPCSTPALEQLPPTPPASTADFACIDEKLATELTIDEEFGDDFVTQVYNYLSLGYPSIARMFDEELSRISHVATEELQADDHLATFRGYIRLGEDGNLQNSEVTEETCVRWRALRVYIHEWARQQPSMSPGDNNLGIGTAPRRGSWAI